MPWIARRSGHAVYKTQRKILTCLLRVILACETFRYNVPPVGSMAASIGGVGQGCLCQCAALATVTQRASTKHSSKVGSALPALGAISGMVW